MKKLLLLCAFISLSGCSSHNVDDIKLNAEHVFNESGFKIIGYEGYQYGLISTPGGCVWYVLEKIDSNKILYHACLSKWGNEYHIYSLQAIDAIKGQ